MSPTRRSRPEAQFVPHSPQFGSACSARLISLLDRPNTCSLSPLLFLSRLGRPLLFLFSGPARHSLLLHLTPRPTHVTSTPPHLPSFSSSSFLNHDPHTRKIEPEQGQRLWLFIFPCHDRYPSSSFLHLPKARTLLPTHLLLHSSSVQTRRNRARPFSFFHHNRSTISFIFLN